MSRKNSEFREIDFSNGVVEVIIEVLVDEHYKDKRVVFRMDRNIYPWKFTGYVEGVKIEILVPPNAQNNEHIEPVILPDTVSELSEKRIIDALEEFLDRQFN